MAKTAKQVLTEQKEQAERDHIQLPAVSEDLPAVPDDRSPRERYLDSVAPSGIVGRLAKFDGKVGQFLFIDTEEKIADTEDFIVLGDQTFVAWLKFRPEQSPLRIGGLLYAPNFALPSRHMLGDLDQTKWPIGKYSKGPEDPWKEEMLLVLKRPATQELFTFSTTNKTGRRAVGNLLKHHDRLQLTSPGSCPVVRCKTGSYQDDDFGRVFVPNFVVVGTSPGLGLAIPDTTLKNEMNDELPF